MQADRPISKIEEDRLDRAPFAKRIAEVMAQRVDPSSLVVGIYGPWGDGKTSTLGMIKEVLRKNSDIVLIDYNPWFYGANTESITRSFFGTIGDALEKSGFFSRDKIGEVLTRFGKMIPTFGDNISAAGEAMTAEALTATRDRVSEILEKHKKRVVVFIDDIDRLDRREIQTLFKLVRLSGDFFYTTYVLAFDEAVVAEALGEAYGSGDTLAGRGFLEKIIQVPLHLPPASPEIIRKTVFASCDRVLADNGIEIGDGYAYKLGNSLAALLSLRPRTPRQAKLYDNAISFAVPILKGEVNVIDQMLIEAIRIFYPHLYKAIRDNEAAFLDKADLKRGSNEVRPVVTSALESTGLSAEEQSVLKSSVLEKLFPRISQMGYGGEWDATWARDKHVASKDYFDRYFTYAVPTGDISDLSVDEIVDLARQEKAGVLSNILDSVIANQSFEQLITKLRQREDAIPLAAVPTLVNAVAAESDKIKFTREMLVGDWAFTQAAILLAHLIRRLAAENHEGAVAQAMETSATVPFAIELLIWCRAYVKDGEQRGFLTPEVHQRLLEATWTRLIQAASQSSLFELGGERLSRTLFYCYRLGPENLKIQIRAYLDALVSQDTENAMLFVRMVTGTSWGMESGVPHVSDFGREAYNSLKALVDPGAIYSQLHGRFGDSIKVDRYVHDYEEPNGDVDLRLARQFAYLHTPPITEAADASVEHVTEDETGDEPAIL